MTQSNQSPGEHRLARPPSDRYREEEAGPEARDVADGRSAGRGIALGIVAAGLVAAVVTVAGGVLLITAGLLAVAAIGGWVVAMAVRTGAGNSLAPPQRVALSVVLALAGVALGQLGLWAYGQLEGGALAPIAYLTEVFGFLVPLQLALAGIVAWLAAR